MSATLMVVFRIMPDGATHRLTGRVAWAFLHLLEAGRRGCTPIDQPGPRWSAYVHLLRREYGLAIETRHEPHKGPFPGTHARYILQSAVEVISKSEDAERDAA
jgi:hypothetical protein